MNLTLDMNLIIDVGNTFVKFAVFQNDRLVVKRVFKSENIKEELDILCEEYSSVEKAIISSVAKLRKQDLVYLNEKLNLIQLNSKTTVPFTNMYETPHTLGLDRIALVAASIKHYSNSNVLIIDAGTCITYDFVNDKNEYLGGAISPGISMRYESLHTLTANLPLLKMEEPNALIGNSTRASIHSGVMNGVLKEIDGNIESYRDKYSNLTVILTGGDSNFLSKQLKSSIFANSNFLLEGLNYILQINSN